MTGNTISDFISKFQIGIEHIRLFSITAEIQNEDAEASYECSHTLDESWITITFFENCHIF
jgi:hypothetical protein